MDWQGKLISLYLFICNEYKKHLWSYCERMTNYADLSFSDEEVITLYLFGVIQRRKQVKEIYMYADQHLRDWFPKLPTTYTAFVQRLNRVASVFSPLIEVLLLHYPDAAFSRRDNPLLIDSLPIILAHRGRRFKVKVAPELRGDDVFGDKAYNDCFVDGEKNFTLYTPVKKGKGQEFLDAADQLWSTAVSHVRQPIESFFNWVEAKTGIQIASKVRSFNGLLVHVFGKLAAALCIKCVMIGS